MKKAKQQQQASPPEPTPRTPRPDKLSGPGVLAALQRLQRDPARVRLNGHVSETRVAELIEETLGVPYLSREVGEALERLEAAGKVERTTATLDGTWRFWRVRE